MLIFYNSLINYELSHICSFQSETRFLITFEKQRMELTRIHLKAFHYPVTLVIRFLIQTPAKKQFVLLSSRFIDIDASETAPASLGIHERESPLPRQLFTQHLVKVMECQYLNLTSSCPLDFQIDNNTVHFAQILARENTSISLLALCLILLMSHRKFRCVFALAVNVNDPLSLVID